jgi:hypothetical protein
MIELPRFFFESETAQQIGEALFEWPLGIPKGEQGRILGVPDRHTGEQSK